MVRIERIRCIAAAAAEHRQVDIGQFAVSLAGIRHQLLLTSYALSLLRASPQHVRPAVQLSHACNCLLLMQ